MTKRPTTTIKTEGGDTIQIREPYPNSTRKSMNLVFTAAGDASAFGIVISAEDAIKIASAIKLIAERILTEVK
jgi:hypothetical protein